ncbi:MAG TPA: efflux RND transporter periplasmic adaptor subunit [Tepidisphaeraceae bacterium]|nr:efflux RND transporter periplasmic adaptor subunit [Tepidisphaeraceae bacterium]
MVLAGSRKLAFVSALAAASGLICLIGAAPQPGIITAHTEPNLRLLMNFPAVGIIKSVAVKEGQSIKQGDVLMSLDDDIEKDEFDRLSLEANSTARMEYAVKDRDSKANDRDRKKAQPGAFSPSEIEQAQLDLDRAEAQIKVTDLDSQDSKLKAKQQRTKLDKMVLTSKFDGKVEVIRLHEGELTSVDPDKPAIIVVKNDPCYVVINDLHTAQVAKLKEGDTMEVKYPDDANWQQAKIVYITPYVNPSSDLQSVKLEIPNPENRATGLPIQVKLPAKLLEKGSAQGISSRSDN